MNSLSWISDEVLSNIVSKLISQIDNVYEEANEKLVKNVIDPFTTVAIASTLSLKSLNDLMKIQESAQAVKAISMAIGNFHQNVLGSVEGWENHDAGYDLLSEKKQMIAEVKNKHNTMNSVTSAKTISDLDTGVQQRGRGWKGYLVQIVPKKPIRYETELNTTRPVFKIDGASFYTKVTGEEKAIHNLFSVLIIFLRLIKKRPVSEDIENYCKDLLKTGIPQ